MHPAKKVPFDILYSNLRERESKGLIFVKTHDDLELFCYTEKCVYERAWDNYTLMARGLILCPEKKEVVATPFSKFFNYGEMSTSIPNLPFDVYEKMDGSLIITYWWNGDWRCATKGSLQSTQAGMARRLLTEAQTKYFFRDSTYLFELVGPDNKIVVPYEKNELVILGGYFPNREMDWPYLVELSFLSGIKLVERHSFESFSNLLTEASTLPSVREGFVIRFSDGVRIKVKGPEYLRIHNLIAGVTPLGIWNLMLSGDDLNKVRKEIPEEFWKDFDDICFLLKAEYQGLENEILNAYLETKHLTDKELGLALPYLEFRQQAKGFLFPYRKAGAQVTEKMSRSMYMCIRPTRNVLKGYTPSYTVNRILE